MKTSTQSPAGELQMMPIPYWPWQSIEMDYLMPVPESKNENNAIFVIIDRLTKMAYFISITNKVITKETAKLFLQNIFRYRGLSDNIVSDYDPHFISHFWENLHKILGIKLLLFIIEYSQMDDQSEATVKIIQKLIQPFAFQE